MEVCRGKNGTHARLEHGQRGKTAVVALSGGVDSAVCAALLLEEGYDVVAVTLDLSSAADALDSAARVAGFLKIPHHILDAQAPFKRHVIRYFSESYARGETPLPCAQCNKYIKFGLLREYANSLGADVLATGHYARLRLSPEGVPQIVRAKDPRKDQSYFLFGLPREALPHLLFPIGKFTKSAVRSLAAEYGLPNHETPESQDICFVKSRSYVDVVQAHSACAGAFREGEIRDASGRLIGHHRGIAHYTVGQRKGLSLALEAPAYVAKIDAKKNLLIVGGKEDTACFRILVKDVNWLSPPCEASPQNFSFLRQVKVRSTGASTPALIESYGDFVRVTLEHVEYGVAPGQACVFYDGERLLGGGWILHG